jgi:hypothetical protein
MTLLLSRRALDKFVLYALNGSAMFQPGASALI